MYKKGISPLIATILLIGMTIGVSLMVFTFIRSVAEDTMADTDLQTNLLLACSQNLRLEYDDPMPCGFGTTFKVSIWNRSPLDISSIKLQVIGENTFLFEDDSGINSYHEGNYEFDIGFSVDTIKKFNIIPIISIEETDQACSAITVEINELDSCA